MRFSGIFVIIVAMFVAVLVSSNIIAVKVICLSCMLGLENVSFIPSLYLPASIIIFPISYIIGNLLTEVYGFHMARGVIWLGFVANIVVLLALLVTGSMPGAPFWSPEQQDAYVTILGRFPLEGLLPFILLGSFFAYLTGEFSNSTVLALLKYTMRGRMLWVRTIGSTVVGQGLDSIIFISIAFGIGSRFVDGMDPWGMGLVVATFLTQWVVKIIYEVIATPFTYAIVGYMKRKEQMDVTNVPRSLNPFGVFAASAEAKT